MNTNVPVQTRPSKPPNYSKYNLTEFKLREHVFQSSAQLLSAHSGVSYSHIVNGNTSVRAPNIAGKSTLKSTNDLPSPSVSETSGTTVK